MSLRVSLAVAFFLLAPSVLVPAASAGNVARSFSSGSVSQEGLLTVTLTVDVNETQEDIYAIEEDYPEGWSVVDSGGMSSQDPGYLKKVVISNAADTEYHYALQAPTQTGNYTWSGQYLFENMSQELEIGGETRVTVTEAPPAPPGDEPSPGGSSPAPGAGCSPDWTCTDWGECQPGGNQARTCTDSNSCGSALGMPEEYRNCTYAEPYNMTGECVESWFCGSWSECTGGVQTRLCVDMKGCGTSWQKPPESQACTGEAAWAGSLLTLLAITITASLTAFILITRKRKA